MRNLLLFLPALACAGAMYACMRMMAGSHGMRESMDAAGELAELRAEVKRLRTKRQGPPREEPVDG